MLLQFRQHVAHTIIDRLDHCRIFPVGLRHPFLEFVFVGHFLNRLNRRVNRIMRNLDKEGTVFPIADQFDRLIRLAMGQVFSGLSSGQFVDARPNRGVTVLGVVVGIKKRGGLTIVAAAEVFMISLLFRIPGFVAQVPFSNVGGLVATFAQILRKGDFRTVHPIRIGRAEELAVLAPTYSVGFFSGVPNPPR